MYHIMMAVVDATTATNGPCPIVFQRPHLLPSPMGITPFPSSLERVEEGDKFARTAVMAG